MREQFICVRLTSMSHVDISRFEFDYDNTWSGFFLDANLNVYSRYGGRDGGEPEERLSLPSLLSTMRKVLAAHKQASIVAADQKAAYYQPTAVKSATPEDIPLLKKNHHGCVHCHQVREYQFLQQSHDGTFNRRTLFGWPLPENIGLKFARNHGHRVEGVQEQSAAEEAELRVGDEIIRFDNSPVRSEFDFRRALHHADADKATLVIDRRETAEGPSRKISLELQLSGQWRQTNLSWRKSLRSVPLEFGFRGYAMTRSQLRAEGLPPGQLAIRITSVRNRGLSGALGLLKRDIIIALEDRTPARSLDELKSDFLRRYQPGQEVRLKVRRKEKTVELSGPFPQWHTDETSVP